MSSQQAAIGLIGLGVMGQNLARNLAARGVVVAIFNRTAAQTKRFLATAAGCSIHATYSYRQLLHALQPPRQVLLLVRADAVDAVIDHCLPFLAAGDLLLDGGNSHYADSERRYQQLAQRGIRFLGIGISGGSAGARHGPSIMVGGDLAGWQLAAPLLQAIAARSNNAPCCDWVGSGGAGHFVKMVHNGIEYALMQLLSEGYALLRALGLSAPQLATVLAAWNDGQLASYLLTITAQILNRQEQGRPLIDQIDDVAASKGSGRWAASSALEKELPSALMATAVAMRCLSQRQQQRQRAAACYPPPAVVTDHPPLDALRDALYAASIVCYGEGFLLLHAAPWRFDLAAIARLWSAGCIIRSRLLQSIEAAYASDPQLPHVLVAPFAQAALQRGQQPWRAVVSFAVRSGIAIPCLSATLAFFDAYRSQRLPTQLLQAQRDFFGAHGYSRIDAPNAHFHTQW